MILIRFVDDLEQIKVGKDEIQIFGLCNLGDVYGID